MALIIPSPSFFYSTYNNFLKIDKEEKHEVVKREEKKRKKE